jgi:putative phosphoesterase
MADGSEDGIHRIGLISDTHGLLRPDVFGALAGVETILHAGDVGGGEILDGLNAIAPVVAVYGNTDPPGDSRLAGEREGEWGGVRVHVSHGHELGVPTPERLLERYPHDVLVYGHTHRALVVRVGGRLVVNPGAAGPRRFNLAPSVAVLTITSCAADVQLMLLRA